MGTSKRGVVMTMQLNTRINIAGLNNMTRNWEMLKNCILRCHEWDLKKMLDNLCLDAMTGNWEMLKIA